MKEHTLDLTRLERFVPQILARRSSVTVVVRAAYRLTFRIV